MDVAEALTQLLRTFEIDQPRSLYDVGAPLIGQGFMQSDVLDALFFLRSEGKIELLDGNRVRVVSLL